MTWLMNREHEKKTAEKYSVKKNNKNKNQRIHDAHWTKKTLKDIKKQRHDKSKKVGNDSQELLHKRYIKNTIKA